MKRAGFTLIGVAHRDPDGFNKLMEVFERRRPRAISIELSPLSLLFRLKNSARLTQILLRNINLLADENGMDAKAILSKGFVREIMSQIDLPFEYTASKAYGAASGALIVAVDSSFSAKNKLPRFQSLVSLENLRTLIKETDFSLERKTTMEYRRAAHGLWKNITLQDLFVGWSGEQRAEWVAREKIMARRIRRIVSRVHLLGGGEAVHVGGWMHCAEDGLYRELRDFQPEIELLGGGGR